MKEPGSIYQLKVTLNDVSPAVWRRLQVPADLPLARLHAVLQRALGWTNSHLHVFRVGPEEYGPPDPESGWQDYRKFRLQDIAGVKDKFHYDYDLGDGWEHSIAVEKVLPPAPGVTYPVCVAGARSRPPEDCGGPLGYERLLEILQDPKHEQYADMKEWIGDHYDPEEFDMAFINEALRSRKKLEPWT